MSAKIRDFFAGTYIESGRIKFPKAGRKGRPNSRWCRERVAERDHGICALCGVDTFELEEAQFQSTWEVDHIVPLWMGGSGRDLDNMRTLCIDCHKKETSRLSRRKLQKWNGTHWETR